MLPKTKTERHSDICKEINALYAMKNHDYGALGLCGEAVSG